jgi:hypothetical protein
MVEGEEYEFHGIVDASPRCVILVARPTSPLHHFVEVRVLWKDPDGTSGRQDAVLTFEETAHLVEALANALRASLRDSLDRVGPSDAPR